MLVGDRLEETAETHEQAAPCGPMEEATARSYFSAGHFNLGNLVPLSIYLWHIPYSEI